MLLYCNNVIKLFLHCMVVAYSGRFCANDVDGCVELSCFEGVTCEDIEAPGIGASCGHCPEGFMGDGQKCIGKYYLSKFFCKRNLLSHVSSTPSIRNCVNPDFSPQTLMSVQATLPTTVIRFALTLRVDSAVTVMMVSHL